MRFSRRDLNMYTENKEVPTHEQITQRAGVTLNGIVLHLKKVCEDAFEGHVCLSPSEK
jgi:hypothetical protein